MAVRRPFFKSQQMAYFVGFGLVLTGVWCFHDAFGRRGQNAPWLLKTVTPGM